MAVIFLSSGGALATNSCDVWYYKLLEFQYLCKVKRFFLKTKMRWGIYFRYRKLLISTFVQVTFPSSLFLEQQCKLQQSTAKNMVIDRVNLSVAVCTLPDYECWWSPFCSFKDGICCSYVLIQCKIVQVFLAFLRTARNGGSKGSCHFIPIPAALSTQISSHPPFKKKKKRGGRITKNKSMRVWNL